MDRTGKNEIRILVCGGRHYGNKARVFSVLDEIHKTRGVEMLIHGAATGADSLAEQWAKAREIRYCGVPAQWKKQGSAAGPIRNAFMLDNSRCDLLVAFPGGTGTKGMVGKASDKGVEILRVEES